MKTELAYQTRCAPAPAIPAPDPDRPRPGVLAAPADAPLFLLDWGPVLLQHLAVAPAALASAVPFALDLFDQRAWVSLRLAALTRLRIHTGGRWVDWPLSAARPVGVLTVAAAVRHEGVPGWFVLDQWFGRDLLPRSVGAGRQIFGLPCQPATFAHPTLNGHGEAAGCITADGGGALSWSVRYRPQDAPAPAVGPRAAFLRERSCLFAMESGLPRAFAGTLLPPAAAPADFALADASLLASAAWWSAAQPGAAELALAPTATPLGRPRCIAGPACLTPWPELSTPSPSGTA